MDKRAFKNSIYGGIAQMTRALANPHRLEIIDLLAQGEKTVETIAGEVGASVANVSQHLQVLKQARLVNIRKQGHYVYYTLSDPAIFLAWQSLRSLSIRQLPDVEKLVRDFRTDRDTLEGISIDELLRRLESEQIVLVDVRPTDEYRMGHIPQALSAPPDAWGMSFDHLPRTKEIIAYCRGPFCVYADEAVAHLKSKGYRAFRLEAGFPDWQAQGLPVAVLS